MHVTFSNKILSQFENENIYMILEHHASLKKIKNKMIIKKGKKNEKKNKLWSKSEKRLLTCCSFSQRLVSERKRLRVWDLVSNVYAVANRTSDNCGDGHIPAAAR